MSSMKRMSIQPLCASGRSWSQIQAWFRSRERGLWEKGATSGNRMDVVEVRLDCDGDSVLLRVNPLGPACHTGAESCFFNQADAG